MLVSFGYRLRNSLIDKIDPRTRWIFALLVLFAILDFWDIRILAGFLALTFLQYFAARLTWKETRRAWLFISLILAMMILVNTLITGSGTIGGVISGGHPIFTISAHFPLTGWPLSFSLTYERVWFALTQIVRILAISAMFITIPFTMDPRSYGATFQGMKLNDRLAFSLDLAFRFIPTLGRDFSMTLDAQRARGYEVEKVEGGIFAQVRKVAPLIVPVTMNAILSGEDIANAMDLRCFGLNPRTWVLKLKFHWYDYVIIAISILILAASTIAHYFFHIGGFWIPAWFLPH
jgi:energy-coupling factor transport system permease protein